MYNSVIRIASICVSLPLFSNLVCLNFPLLFTDEHRLNSARLCLIILTCIAEVSFASIIVRSTVVIYILD